MAYKITDECIKCGICVDECPVEACGACADACPSEAIIKE